jgi:hypothetical protein
MQIGIMGSVISLLRNLTSRMGDGQIFTTRSIIGIGSRPAIDNAISALVKEGAIVRLARGVFAKAPLHQMPAPFVIARIKAESFGREFLEHQEATAQRISLTEKLPPKSRNFVYATTASSSSSFQYGRVRIHLKAISARRRQLQRGCEVSDLLKGLWHLGRWAVKKKLITKRIKGWGIKQTSTLSKLAPGAPYWLTSWFKTNQRAAYAEIEKRLGLETPPPLLISPATYEDSNTPIDDIFEPKIPYWEDGKPCAWDEQSLFAYLS